MVSTNDKKVRMAVQAHIKSQLKGNGGISGMVRDINNVRVGYGGRISPVSKGCRDYVVGGNFYAYTADAAKLLNKIGFTESAINRYGGAWDLYVMLTSREVEALYNDYVRTHAKR